MWWPWLSGGSPSTCLHTAKIVIFSVNPPFARGNFILLLLFPVLLPSVSSTASSCFFGKPHIRNRTVPAVNGVGRKSPPTCPYEEREASPQRHASGNTLEGGRRTEIDKRSNIPLGPALILPTRSLQLDVAFAFFAPLRDKA